MKKFTKRLTMVVAILLSLVLLTSSIVSTTLAKYVVAKSAETTAKLDKFGVTVELNATSLGTPDTTTNAGDSVTYVFSNILLHPDDAVKTISASVYGKPTVDANIIVDVKVEFTGSYSIGTAFSNLTNNTTYFPVEFKVGNATCSAPYTKDTAATISTNINTAIENALLEPGKIAKDGTNIKWTENQEITQEQKKNVSLSFSWPKSYGNENDLYDEIGTYISKNQPTFKITYKIAVEQA